MLDFIPGALRVLVGPQWTGLRDFPSIRSYVALDGIFSLFGLEKKKKKTYKILFFDPFFFLDSREMS